MGRTATYLDIAQRSDEWFALRCGKLTGSRAKDMLAAIRSGESAARRDLRVQLCVERLTGTPYDSGEGFVNAAMQWGIDTEAEARHAYEALTGQTVWDGGFIEHATHRAGHSPDGIVGDGAGLLEIKCPLSATHLGYLRSGELPTRHLAQLRHGLWVAGRQPDDPQWIDFFSYDPRFPDGLQTFLRRLTLEEADLDTYDHAATAFLCEVDDELDAIHALKVA
jgi:hypothetical protein